MPWITNRQPAGKAGSAHECQRQQLTRPDKPTPLKVEIRHRFNQDVIFTANIDADASADNRPLTVRLAVEEALKTNADLRGAALRTADLDGRNPCYVNFGDDVPGRWQTERLPDFYCGNDEALADMKRLAGVRDAPEHGGDKG